MIDARPQTGTAPDEQTEMRYPTRASELDHRRLQVPLSPLHDPSPSQLHTGAHAEIIGRSHYEILPDIPPRWREIHARVLAGEELSHEEDPFPRQDGHIDRVQWSMKPWRTADGRIGGAILFSQLMTRALAEREARFQATFENAAVGIAHVSPDGRWLRVNEALCRILVGRDNLDENGGGSRSVKRRPVAKR
jgi:PAS domain-containing protein